MYRLELVLKEDFLDLYFDTYFDISYSDDKTKLFMTNEKKK
jgi:hypothetical protein